MVLFSQPTTPREALRPHGDANVSQAPGDLHTAQTSLAGVRGMLTMLVVFGHASLPFLGVDPSPDDPSWVRLLEHVSTLLAAVRMPAFLLLAGMVIWRGIDTNDAGAYVAKRLMRLGVPLGFVLVMINPLEIWLRIRHGELLGRWQTETIFESTIPGVLDGTAILHLWFIRALLYTTLLSPLLAGAVARMSREVKIGVVVALLFIGSGAQIVSWHLDATFQAHGGGELLTPSRLLLVIRFVTIGMIFSSDPKLLVWLLGRVRAAMVLISLAAAVVVATTGSRAPAAIVLHTLAMAALPIPSIVVLSAILQSNITWRRSFVDLDSSGYTIYLFHHIMVVASAVALKTWLGNSVLAFVLTFGIGLTAPLLLDLHVVRRYGLFAFLINGVLTSNGRRSRSGALDALQGSVRHSG